jgi:hypothetical protein
VVLRGVGHLVWATGDMGGWDQPNMPVQQEGTEGASSVCWGRVHLWW